MTEFDKALNLAVHAHTGQIDEDGYGHIFHCMEVMLAVKKKLENPDFLTKEALDKYSANDLLTAILHDVVEDSSITLDQIEQNFGSFVKHLVDCLTRRKHDQETYRDFIYRCKLDPGAALIKSADLSHNLSRTHKIKKANWRKKLEFKYDTALRVLYTNRTWEQASWRVFAHQGESLRYSIADPNGKIVEISKEESDKILKTNQ